MDWCGTLICMLVYFIANCLYIFFFPWNWFHFPCVWCQLTLFLRREQFLFSSDAAEELKEAISKKNHELVYLYDINLVDEIWKDSRPKPRSKPVRVHELKYAGVDVASKLNSLRSELKEAGSSAIVIFMLDEIAWLLNLVIFNQHS